MKVETSHTGPMQVFSDRFGWNNFVPTGEVRVPSPGEYYVSTGRDYFGMALRRGNNLSDAHFKSPKQILAPLVKAGATANISISKAPVNMAVDNNYIAVKGAASNTPVGQPRNHKLARYVRNVTYQHSGRATAAVATVILPGVGAAGIFQGLGLSLANETDKFSRTEGRRIALLRALDNVASHI